jgi:putative oxidoreductase
MRKYLHLSARGLLALIFVISGLGKLAAFNQTKEFMGASGLPFPGLLLITTIAIEVIGGVCLLIGYKTKLSAAGLVAFLVPVTLVIHASHLADPAQAQMQLMETLKNLAIMGGLLSLAADGPGSLAIDNASGRESIEPFSPKPARLSP